MRAQRQGGPVRIGGGAHFRAPQQSFGGRFGPAFGGRFGPVARRPFGGPVVFRHRRSFGVFFGNGCFNCFGSGCFNCPFFPNDFFFRRRFLQFVFVPFPIYAAPYYSQPYYPVEQTEQQAVTYSDTGLTNEIANLRGEVAQLRADEAAREQARQAAAHPTVKEEKPHTTILVFRDKHRQEIQNYAIAGQTLWVFTESRATKIPISSLDKEATRNVNADRGVEIQLP